MAVPLAVMAADGTQVGQVTSGIWSPRLGCNVGMSMIARDHWDAGTAVIVRDADGAPHEGVVASLPL